MMSRTMEPKTAVKIDVRSCGDDGVVSVRHGMSVAEKALAMLLCAMMAWTLCSWIVPGRADSASAPTEVTSYTVRPGDTLWSYAEMITPAGGDVSRSVALLQSMNDLDSSTLEVGQRIIVPVE
ncbi:LysM peptidoglycan-binding domain-containing protein [Bifidobacterium aerophilum]|nr:LysM peptidoglycan-binding domain-containing protein [Bifidobacterium aerophilum]